jgi:hypothetical protein
VRGTLVASLALATVGCLSTGSVPPGRDPRSSCIPEPGLTAIWGKSGLTQLGPAWSRLVFDCDCRYRIATTLLWARLSEEGYYRVAPMGLHVERPWGRDLWQYRRHGDLLWVQFGREVPFEEWRRVGPAPGCPE